MFEPESSDCVLFISGGTISGVDSEDWINVVSSGWAGHEITISGGEIWHISLWPESSNNTLTLTGDSGITDNDIYMINYGTGNTFVGVTVDER